MPVMYFGNDESTPYLYMSKYNLSFDYKLHTCLLEVDTIKVCIRCPDSVQEYGGLSGSKFSSAILQFNFIITLLCFLIMQFGLLVTAPKFIIVRFKYAIL